MRMLTLLLPALALLASCSSETYSIYKSSEGGGAAVAINPETGEYAKVLTRNWRNIAKNEFGNRLVTVRETNYYYETQFGFVIPRDKMRGTWGDGKVQCVLQGEGASNSGLVICKFSNGRSSEFHWNDRDGVTSFFTRCLTKDDTCEYRLVQGTGIFSSQSASLFLQ